MNAEYHIIHISMTIFFFSLSMTRFFLFSFVVLLPCTSSQVSEFVSIDCGGQGNYTDPETGLEWISDSNIMAQGISVVNPGGGKRQFQNRRDFPIDNKYCYTLNTEEGIRYLVRASFHYGNSVYEEAYPKFDLYLDTTKWSTVTILETSRFYVTEMIIRAPSNSVCVCLCCSVTGSPFMSTLELRPLNLSMYETDYEDNFFLKVAARVNFGAETNEAIRYPDDPYDRIWQSDLDRRENFLVGMASGTERIDTLKSIDTGNSEFPPVRVMQTAVLGTHGILTYRLDLEGFPASARAYAYFAEIQDLQPSDARKFKLELPYVPDYSNAVVNIAENANGSYRLYEPSYMNVSLDFVLSFSFIKTRDSNQGPLLNAMEISKYLQIASKTDISDVIALYALRSLFVESSLTKDQGDPCIPTPWEWLTCSSDLQPRIVKIVLSGKSLKGEIPKEVNNLQKLAELRLDNNSLTGPLPDISNLVNLETIHLENNKLTGPLPDFVTFLNLRELYLQNNFFSGVISQSLLSSNITINYDHNPGLRTRRHKKMQIPLLIGLLTSTVTVSAIALLGFMVLICRRKRRMPQPKIDHQGNSPHTSAMSSSSFSLGQGGLHESFSYYISFPEIEEATANFSKKIGKGSLATVYHGQMKDGKEVAVKIIENTTTQLAHQVSVLMRIHHRNLVPLIGFCENGKQHILVYEYMYNGTLKDHIQGSVKQEQLGWLDRLQIAEDTAKALRYLHTGCNPSIIHGDVKASNILLDMNMRAKVSDFGISWPTDNLTSRISRGGSMGYLDPEYYASQKLTEKSDIFSFGVVLLELMSGKRHVSADEFGPELNIVLRAKDLINAGKVESTLAPELIGKTKIESLWRIADVALQCVATSAAARPGWKDIILGIQDAINLQKGISGNHETASPSSMAQTSRKTLLTSFLEIESSIPDNVHSTAR